MSADFDPEALGSWYYKYYAGKRHSPFKSAFCIAQKFATTVGDYDPVMYPGNVGALHGALGEMLTLAGLELLTERRYDHFLSCFEDDGQGLDIVVGDPRARKLISGWQIKLSCTPCPRFNGSLPVVSLRMDRRTLGIENVIQAQQAGSLLSPRRHIESLFTDESLRAIFVGTIANQCGELLKTIPDAGNLMPAHSYLNYLSGMN